jgi:hypothetical protein
VVNPFVDEIPEPIFMKRKRKRLWPLLALAPLAVVTLAAFLQSWGARERAAPSDAILIFGARVNSSGQASPILRARTRHAYELWRKKLAPRLVCTGGVGTFAPAEAEVSAALLRSGACQISAIICENRSTSTRENAEFAAKLLPAKRACDRGFRNRFTCGVAPANASALGFSVFTRPNARAGNALGVDQKTWYLAREVGAVMRDWFRAG